MKLRIDRAVKTGWKLWEQPILAWTLSILWLLLLSWLAFLWHLGSTGLVDETEPLFAEAARQMTVTGDWITPYFNGDTRFDKPPLVYWLMAIAYQILGVNEWAVRLPSALAAITLMGLGFYTLLHFGIPRPAATQTRRPAIAQNRWLAAWLGAALIATNPQTIVWARVGVSDMLLSGCVGTALLAFFLGYASEEATPRPIGTAKSLIPSRFPTGWYLTFYILVALAVLAKGPVGLVLPVLIIGAFLIYLGKSREVLREMRLLVGGLIVLAITLPWYVLVTLRNGEEYIDSFFGYHNLERFTQVVNHHSAPWYFYFLVVLVGFAPWSIYLPLAIARLRFWQRQRWRTSPRSTHLGLFALFWLLGIFGFFTIAVTKLPSYVLPLMPAAAILVALLWSDPGTGELGDAGFRRSVEPEAHPKGNASPAHAQDVGLLCSGVFNVVFLLILAGAIWCSPRFVGYDPAAPNLAQLLQQSGLPWRGGIIWGATAVGAGLLMGKPLERRWLWIPNLIGFLAFIIFVLTPVALLMDQARQLPLRELSAIATSVRQGNEELIMIGFKKPSVVFYTQRPVTYFSHAKYAIAHIEKNTTPESPSVLILASPGALKETELQPNEYTTLSRAGAYQLVRVSKQVIARR